MRKFMRCLRWIAIDILFVAMFVMSIGAAMIVANFFGVSDAEFGQKLVGIALIAALPMAVMLAMARAMRRSMPKYYGVIYRASPEEDDGTSDESTETEEENGSESEDAPASEDTDEETEALDMEEDKIDEDEPYEESE